MNSEPTIPPKKTKKHRVGRIGCLCILLFFLFLYGPTLLMPFFNSNFIPGAGDLETYVEEHGRMPPSEAEYARWLAVHDETAPQKLPSFDIACGLGPDDLEMFEGRLITKSDSKPCRLIYGGKDWSFRLFMGWKYNRKSRQLYDLMRNYDNTNPVKNGPVE